MPVPDPISSAVTGSALIRGFKALTDIAAKLQESVGGAEAKKQAAELLGIVTKLQMDLLEAVTREHDQAQQIRELRGELQRVADWEEEAKNYQLKNTAASGMLYVSTGAATVDRPKHYLCADCFVVRRKAFLQPGRVDGPYEMLKCNTCGAQVPWKDIDFSGMG